MMARFDSKLPLNVNDSDLDPAMTELPEEREGATDMIFCSLRNQFSTFFLSLARGSNQSFDFPWHPLISQESSVEEKDKVIDELLQTVEEKFLRYCDPLNPLHILTSIAARSAQCGMRLRAHHPRQYPDGGASLPQKEKDMLFSLSAKIMQYYSLVHSTPALQRYEWHVHAYFQWHALIYLLSELRFRKVGEDVDRAWNLIEDAFQYHPEIINDRGYALYTAIRSLTMKAWEGKI
jgi:hypothetical protein